MKTQPTTITESLLGLNFWSVIILSPARRFKSQAAALILAYAFGAEAAPVYFFNDPVAARSSFRAAVSGPLTLESFESAFSEGASVSFPIGGPLAFTVSSSDGTIRRDSFSRGVTDGSFAMAISEDAPGRTLTFAFSSPINAFGLDVNDLNFVTMSFGDNVGNMNPDVLVGDNGGPAGGPDFQNLQFFGVVNSTPFSTVQLTFAKNITLSTGTIFLDRLEFATVPEPSTYVLIIAGGALVMVTRKWKYRNAASS